MLIVKVLLVGSLCDDKWIGSLLRELKKVSSIEFDFFHIVVSDRKLSEASKLCDNVFYVNKHFPSILYVNSKISYLLSLLDVPISIKEFTTLQQKNNIRYDVVNIHYPQNKVLRCWKEWKLISTSIIITPWGSEVLRISNFSKRLMACYVSHYDYIMSSDNVRFRNQLKDILHIPDNKFLSCDFGSEMIDEICSNSLISNKDAKKHFGIDDNYAIVCGYNAGVAQNHIKIIDSLMSVRKSLPHNFVVILPMTYNGTAAYIKEVDDRLTNYNIRHVILTNYMSNAEMVYLRKCADMFIHAQDTDANSVSLAEHLLCNNTVVNASWLRYANREAFGIPYYLFDSFDDLPAIIVKAYNGGSLVSKKLIDSISEEGWSVVSNKWIEIFKNVSKYSDK